MDAARIAKLLRPFLTAPMLSPSAASNLMSSHSEPAKAGEESLSPYLLDNISTYINLLLRWNARINLTAVREPEEIVSRHFGESLFAARQLFPEERRLATDDCVDVGSGAGFPGLPIKLWAPEIRLTLIESNHKKATFLREVIRALTLTTIDVFGGRAEDLPSATASLVTLRAVERFETIVPIAVRLVAPTGRLALLIGQGQVDQACKLAPHLTWADPLPVPLSRSRILLVGSTT